MAATRAQMDALLTRLEGPVRQAFARAIRSARGRANINAIIAAIEAGNVDAVLAAAGIRDGMWSALTEALRGVYSGAGAFILAADLPKRFALEFNINNPRAEGWLRASSSQLITGNLVPEQRSAIQIILQNGMMRGDNPRTTALNIVGRVNATGRRAGGVLGLTGQQAGYALNMADDLVNLDPRYFNRVLRDRRYDTVVKKSFDAGISLPKNLREQIVARYEARLLKYRGDTVARTETLRALNEAADEALRQVIDEGLAPKNAVQRVWRHSFSKNEREGHLRMNGTARGLDELFTNPITGAVLKHPGDETAGAGETINCRCYLEHKIDFFAVEQAA